MGKKYIIELEDKPFHKGNGDFLYRVKGFNSLVFDMTGINKLTPYAEPDIELIKQKAHDNGYSEGYQDGHSKGMNDYLQNPEVKEESDRAYAHGYSDAESKFSEIRIEAYQKGYETGYEDGYNEPGKNQQEAYQQGLNDAWEAARKIQDAGRDLRWWLHNYTAAEATEKLKAYEQEQNEIKPGDELQFKDTGNKFIVTRVFACEGDRKCEGFFDDGEVYEISLEDNVEKTGRYFPEIVAVLEKMASLRQQAAAAK